LTWARVLTLNTPKKSTYIAVTNSSRFMNSSVTDFTKKPLCLQWSISPLVLDISFPTMYGFLHDAPNPYTQGCGVHPCNGRFSFNSRDTFKTNMKLVILFDAYNATGRNIKAWIYIINIFELYILVKSDMHIATSTILYESCNGIKQ